MKPNKREDANMWYCVTVNINMAKRPVQLTERKLRMQESASASASVCLKWKDVYNNVPDIHSTEIIDQPNTYAPRTRTLDEIHTRRLHVYTCRHFLIIYIQYALGGEAEGSKAYGVENIISERGRERHTLITSSVDLRRLLNILLLKWFLRGTFSLYD